MRSSITARFVIALAFGANLPLVASARQQQQQPARAAASAPAQATSKSNPASRIEVMAREWTRARDYTREYLDAMPEDGSAFKPVPEVRSFAEQMLHLANANFAFAAAAANRTNPYKDRDLEKLPEFKTKAGLARVVTESYDFAIDALRSLTDARLDEQTTLFGSERTRAGVLAAAFEHQTHHRGQTTVYLRLKGVTPPREKLF